MRSEAARALAHAERLMKNNMLWLQLGARAACGCKNICYKMVMGHMRGFGPTDA